MNEESEESLLWALNCFSELLVVRVIVTDRELVLINIKYAFPQAKNIICTWLMSKNILTNCKSEFDSEDAWEVFQMWINVVQAKTKQQTQLIKINRPCIGTFQTSMGLPSSHSI
jgi:hypothetical protein